MADVKLPPGQNEIDRFPRYGTHMNHPAPAIPAEPAIEVTGAVEQPFSVPLADLARLPRREQTSDFHCVAGWSATGLRWEGVPFQAFYREIVEPRLRPGARITHAVFGGLDRFRAVVAIEDALGDDVLIAEQLDGRALDSDHGAPVRLLSPSQYGHMSVKHLCHIELHTADPRAGYGGGTWYSKLFLSTLIKPHPRARVWREERHASLPGRSVRGFYWRVLFRPIEYLCARGSERRATSASSRR
jgi:DMSO/TMAO reductase YedYZ molybdopterin-dependent catalytic subunit